MPVLTARYEAFEKPGLVISYKAAGGIKIFKGAMVGLNNLGFAVPIHQSIQRIFLGIANETVDTTGMDNEAKSVSVIKSGSFVMKVADPIIGRVKQEHVGCIMYAVSDWEVAVGSGGPSRIDVGRMVGLEMTSTGQFGVRIRIDNFVG